MAVWGVLASILVVLVVANLALAVVRRRRRAEQSRDPWLRAGDQPAPDPAELPSRHRGPLT